VYSWLVLRSQCKDTSDEGSLVHGTKDALNMADEWCVGADDWER